MGVPTKLEFQRGRKLADEGKEHLAFVSGLEKMEFDLEFAADPGDPEAIKAAEDEALFDAMIKALQEHKLKCRGCSSKVIGKLRSMIDKRRNLVEP